ncbi:MAG: hypothetical protein ABIH23_02560, partial [bacterium]
VFEDHRDFGGHTMQGDATYNLQTGEYVIFGTGVATGTLPDYGHAVYSEITGDFRLKAKVSSDGRRAAYIGFSDDLEDREATWYTVWVDYIDNGGAQAFWRTPRGANWETTPEIPSDAQDGLVEVVREGNVFSAYYFGRNTGERIQIDSRNIELTDPIHVFLASWSGSLTEYNVAHFSDVELRTGPSSCNNWELYK